MARDFQMDMEINPIFNTKQFDAGVKRLGEMAKKIHTNRHTRQSEAFEFLTARLTSSLVMSGRATSTTQARIQLEQLLGGGISPQAKSFMRSGQNISQIAFREGRVNPYRTFSEAQISRMRPDLARVTTAYNDLVNKYIQSRETPTEKNKASLLKAIAEIQKSVSDISKNRKKNTKTLENIGRSAAVMQKNVSMWDTLSAKGGARGVMSKIGGGAAGFAKWTLGLLGITSLAALLGKLFKMGVEGFKKGQESLGEQAMYGASRDIGLTRSRAALYGLNENVTAAPHTYALDFRQRMMYGEVSEREWIALSHMGGLGKMIMTGQAAKNPKRFQSALEDYISQNRGNEAEVRQNLRWLGLPQEIMTYGAIKYSDEQKAEMDKAYADYTKVEKESAVLLGGAAADWKKFVEGIKSSTAELASSVVSNEARKRLGLSYPGAGFSDAERAAQIAEANKYFATRSGWNMSWGEALAVGVTGSLSQSSAFSPHAKTMNKVAWDKVLGRTPSYDYYPGTGGGVVINNKTEVTVQGNADDRTANEIAEETSAASSAAVYESMAQAMGGRTSF